MALVIRLLLGWPIPSSIVLAAAKVTGAKALGPLALRPWEGTGVGVDTAGQLLVTAGDNHWRLRSEAAFAHLCGTAPREEVAAHPCRAAVKTLPGAENHA